MIRVAYRCEANQRTRYDGLRRFPDGLLVAGDVVASFRPAYGQGMTVAAMQAERLRDLLAGGTVPCPRTWFRAVADADQFGRVVTLLDPPERLLRPTKLRRVFGRQDGDRARGGGTGPPA